MPSQWLAVDAGTDLQALARRIQRSWESLLAGGALNTELPPEATAELRPAIVDSWRRSLATGLDPSDLLPSIVADPDEMRERWLEHPLGSLRHVLAAHLQMLARESNSLVQVTDPSGLTLHLDGPEWLKARAAEMNLVEGARCAETVNGTNGVGTALAADHPVQVFAFEHFSHHHREWVCSGSPVHDPLSGRLIGVLDLSSPWTIAHPRSLELVTTAAKALEQCLLETRRDQDARLRRRYAGLATKSTDLLVNREGYVLIGGLAQPTPLDLPESGGEVSLGDGSLAVAEPLGQGEAYLLRRIGPARSTAAPAPGRGKGSVKQLAKEHAGLERHLRELADEQAALRRVATLVARESSPQRLFAVVAEQVARIIDVPLVRLVRYESDGSAVELLGGWGESADTLAIGTRWQLDGPGVLASVWRSGRPARLDDYTGLPGQAAVVVQQAGMRSAVASPITVEGRLWGAIAVLSPSREPLPESTEGRLADFTELVATALANAESRADLAASETRARKLAETETALRRVATLVAHESSPEEIFAVIAEEVGHVLSVPIVVVIRYEEDGSLMRVEGGWSERAFPVPMGTRLLLDGPSHFADVWTTGRPARLDDVADLPGQIASAMRQADVGSGAASPIVVEGRIWGAVAVGLFGFSDRLPDDIEVRLADFTELVATALANAENRAGLRRLANQQAALGRVATLVAKGATGHALFSAVAREVAGLFGVSMVSIDRYENGESIVLASLGAPEFPVGSRWPLDGPGVRTLVRETGRPARVDDFSEVAGTAPATARVHGIDSAVGVPIVVDGNVWGILGIGSRQGETLPSDVEQHLAAFTELVSTAIANSDARDQVSRLLDEQSALRRVATLVAEGASVWELFSAVAEEVAGVIGLPVVGVHRYEPDGTFTMVGVAGETTLVVGSRWPVAEEGLSGMILASGRPARKDDYSAMPGPVGAAVRDDRMASMVGVPILVDGRVWGFMVAGGGPGETIPASTEMHLARFTELIATAVSNTTMRAELAASRARVIAAADEARRRIERDLHDGAQQQLVTLALGLRAAEARVPAALEDVRAEVRRFADRLTTVVEELREMSRGIHPAILTEGGLPSALEALTLRSSVPVKLNVRCEGRLPEEVEVAAYYVVSEALTNAAKYADASHVQIDLRAEDETLRLSILDDGSGGADPSAGSGLIGLKDRVEALGGTIEINSPPGSGTRLDVEVPLTLERADSPRLSRVRIQGSRLTARMPVA